ncbi:hypothetical protein Bca52824_062024 [Brassica carinata]|uniref:F-box domain-containing protein n=1 Tax=Brassica carinata TaxID=52824 RepID=A0A8X7QBW9_BRACI|nr:hypothetical protein Bca52824_062024 [Brassica carinata]
MYYEVYVDNGGYMERTIMSFNVRYETFKPIKFPCVDNLQTGTHYLLSYYGRLALVFSSDTKLWILENEKEEKWVCNIDLHLPTHRTDPTGKINYQLNDATVTGEFIYVAVDDEEVHVLYYDPNPLDVTREILLRLPAKSLVRFRCVSKLWSFLTTEPDFIKSFTTRSSSRPRLLLSFGKQATRLFFSLPQHEIPDVDKCLSQNDVSSNHIDLPENYGCMSTFESVHGLISFNEE